MTPDSEFQVPIPPALKQRLVRLFEAAEADGKQDEFLSALKSISQRLRTDPHTFGEETYDLKGLKLTMKVAAVLPLVVEFAVHPGQRLVWIKTFRYV